MGAAKRIVRISPDTLYRDLNGEGVLLQLHTGQYFGLDTVGQRMWQLMIELQDLNQVEEALQSEYAVEPGVLAADLDRFTQQLIEKQLVEVEAVSSSS